MRVPLFGQLILASSLILVSPGGVVSAQAEQQSFSVRVQVSVQAENESVTSKIVSYVSRELRSLGDVVVTDHEPKFRLRILAVELFASGTPTGSIAFATVLIKPFKESAQGQTLKVILENKDSEWAFAYFKDKDLFITHWVHNGATKDLRSLCEDPVAKIDSQYIEPERRDWQASRDELSKEKQ